MFILIFLTVFFCVGISFFPCVPPTDIAGCVSFFECVSLIMCLWLWLSLEVSLTVSRRLYTSGYVYPTMYFGLWFFNYFPLTVSLCGCLNGAFWLMCLYDCVSMTVHTVSLWLFLLYRSACISISCFMDVTLWLCVYVKVSQTVSLWLYFFDCVSQWLSDVVSLIRTVLLVILTVHIWRWPSVTIWLSLSDCNFLTVHLWLCLSDYASLTVYIYLT